MLKTNIQRKPSDLYRGVGQMYVEDHRFRAYYEKYDPRMPEFMRDAMEEYCEGVEEL